MARLPRIRGTQIGLRHPANVDAIKADMRAGRFRFSDPGGRIGGVLDPHGTYHVEEGHHRMVAALELHAGTGDDRSVELLLRWGRWEDRPAPKRSRPMPSRGWWGGLRNRIGY
jgi:filamentous hemagglutinin